IWLKLKVRGSTPLGSVGGGVEELIDQGGRLGLAGFGEGADLEQVLETLLRSLTLEALGGHQAEQVAALRLGHRLRAIPSGGGTAKGSACSRCRTTASGL